MLWGDWWRYRRARCAAPLALAGVAVWGFCSCADAGAALRFGPARTLTPAGVPAFTPHVAYDGQGRATVVWTIYPTCPSGLCRRVQTVRLSASGAPGTVHTLSLANEDVVESEPQVAVDSQGRATVVWESGSYRIEAVQIAADGTPGPVRTLSTPGDAGFPKIAIDSHDVATVVWSRSNGSGGSFQVEAIRIAAGGTLGTVTTLSPPGGDAVDPSLAIDSQDRVTIVWTQFDGAQYRAEQVRLDSSGNPGAVHTLSAAGGNVSLPQVGVDSQGRARVLWEWDTFAFGGPNIVLQTAMLDSSEVEGPVQVLDPAIAEGANAQLALDPHGLGRAVWESQASATIETRTASAAGSLGVAHFLSPSRDLAGQPQIAFDSRDRAVIAFFSSDGAFTRIRAVRLAPDGTPGAVQTLSAGSDSADHPQLAIGSQDQVTVAWERLDSSHTLRVQVAVGQPAPPDTRITGGPRNRSTVVSHSIKLSFTGVPAPFSGQLQCSVDGRPFTTCRSPLRLKRVRDGRHSLRVRAADEDGVDPTPAGRHFIEIGSCMSKARSSGHLAGARRRCRAQVA